MIILPEVAQKLETLLNGVSNPLSSTYEFRVETEGFHLDHNYDQDAGKNFIPVFIESIGGQINPVPHLKQVQNNIRVQFFYPVRFKDDIFALNDYLFDTFVGQTINYGTVSGSALSNISVAQYGELTDLDLKQFEKWVSSKYKKAVNVMETYMSMNIVLYLSTISDSLIFGNEATLTLSATIDSTSYSDTSPIFEQGSIQASCEPSGQQTLGALVPEIESLPQTTSMSSSIKVYIKKPTTSGTPPVEVPNLYSKILDKIFAGKSQELEITATYAMFGRTYARTCYIQSSNLLFNKGEPIYIVLTFVKKASVTV